jgi:hypothetical protein
MLFAEPLHIGPQTAAIPVPADEARMGIGAALTPAGDGNLPPADGCGFLGYFDDHLLLSFFFFPGYAKSAVLPGGKNGAFTSS